MRVFQWSFDTCIRCTCTCGLRYSLAWGSCLVHVPDTWPRRTCNDFTLRSDLGECVAATFWQLTKTCIMAFLYDMAWVRVFQWSLDTWIRPTCTCGLHYSLAGVRCLDQVPDTLAMALHYDQAWLMLCNNVLTLNLTVLGFHLRPSLGEGVSIRFATWIRCTMYMWFSVTVWLEWAVLTMFPTLGHEVQSLDFQPDP